MRCARECSNASRILNVFLECNLALYTSMDKALELDSGPVQGDKVRTMESKTGIQTRKRKERASSSREKRDAKCAK